MISKIADRHLSREACIYIRQSTMGQVRFNQESTERQYNLVSKAEALGWSPQRIRILDRDLGQSGAQTTNREDFKTLVSDVAMGQVGAIFSLEASRLARSNQDWHRLLELCAITSTLVIDELLRPGRVQRRPCARHEGHVRPGRAAHHPRAPPRRCSTKRTRASCTSRRRLVWFLTTTRLHPILTRKCGAARTVFELFERESSAYAVVQRFQELGLRFPRRSYGGAEWQTARGRLTHSRVLGNLANPSLAAPTWRAAPVAQIDRPARSGTQSRYAAERVARRHSQPPSGVYQLGPPPNRLRLAANRTNCEVPAGPARGLSLAAGR